MKTLALKMKFLFMYAFSRTVMLKKWGAKFVNFFEWWFWLFWGTKMWSNILILLFQYKTQFYFAFVYWLIVWKYLLEEKHSTLFKHFFLMRGQSFYSPMMRSNSWVEQRLKLWILLLLLPNFVCNFMALWDEDWWFSIERGSF